MFFSLGFALQLGLMMCYFWGQFDDPIIRRLSLPTHLWMVVAVLAVLPQFPRPQVVKTLLAVAVLGIVAQGVPSMAAHAYNQEYLAGLETAWRRQFIADQPRKDYLVIDNDSILWVAHEVTATTVEAAVRRRDDLVFFMRNHTFSNIYVFQRYLIDANTGKMTLRDGDDLGPDYVLEPVRAERLMTLTQTRMSRLVEIRDGRSVLTKPEPDHVASQGQGRGREGAAGLPRELLQAAPLRRILLFALCGAAALEIGYFAVPTIPAGHMIINWGYYYILGVFSLFAYYAWRFARAKRGVSRGWLRRPGIAGAAIGSGLLFAVWSDPFKHKILFDEFVIQGTAYEMHATKQVSTILRAYNIGGTWLSIDTFLDKRPYFFPFLVSLLHDFTGYRIANIFALNVACAAALLGLLYWFARELAGRGPAMLAVGAHGHDAALRPERDGRGDGPAQPDDDRAGRVPRGPLPARALRRPPHAPRPRRRAPHPEPLRVGHLRRPDGPRGRHGVGAGRAGHPAVAGRRRAAPPRAVRLAQQGPCGDAPLLAAPGGADLGVRHLQHRRAT